MWTPSLQSTFDSLWNSIIEDPCLRCFDPAKLTALRTDFSSKGFDYVVYQPEDDDVSLELIFQFMSGNGFHFLTKTNGGVLHPVAFGGRRARGNEKYLHSYLGEAYCSNYAMNKFCHMCLGCRFVWVTDCYAVKFILSYDCANQAILRLQMRLMGWDMDIVHHRNEHLVGTNNWSRLDADLCYDPLFHHYLHLFEDLRCNHSASTDIPMDVEHMLYYLGPHIPHLQDSSEVGNVNAHNISQVQAPANVIDHAGATIMAQIVTSDDLGPTSLSHCPVQFGVFSSADTPDTKHVSRVLYNSKITSIGFHFSLPLGYIWIQFRAFCLYY